MIPKFADEPDGLGTIVSGFFVAFTEGAGFFVGLGELFELAFGVGLRVGLGVAIFSPSLTVTLIFWPGFRFSIPTFALDPDVEGLIANGDFDGAGFGAADAPEDGFGVGFTDGFGVGFTEGFGVGFTEGFGEGVGVGLTLGEGVGVGVGLTLGVGVGVTLGEGVGVGVTTDGAGALGAGELGDDET